MRPILGITMQSTSYNSKGDIVFEKQFYVKYGVSFTHFKTIYCLLSFCMLAVNALLFRNFVWLYHLHAMKCIPLGKTIQNNQNAKKVK